MNIDLLFTSKGEAGLISNENLVKKVAGVVLDTQSALLTLEFVDMDYLELNIPIDGDYLVALDRCPQVHIGAIKGGHISQAYQIPFMFLDDPYRGEALSKLKQPANPLVAFDYFVKSCVSGQPVHRDDLGDEAAMGCVLGDMGPASLQFAPHLARRHQMEAQPKAAPSGPTPSGLGLGGSSGSGTRYIQPREDDED
jgi:hypothetical protein